MLMVKSIPPEEMRGKNEDFIDEKIQLNLTILTPISMKQQTIP